MVREQAEKIQVGIEIPKPHSESQGLFVRNTALRLMVKAGRRFGKTVGDGIISVEAFLGVCGGCGGEGCLVCDNTGKVRPKRVLYAAPTAEQVGAYWSVVAEILAPGIEGGYLKKNETERIIEIPGTDRRIKAKTAWNANTFRGDWGDLILPDEYQLWNEDAWGDVIQPMLLDTNGRVVFTFTPPSLKSEGVSKAKDPRHASKLFNKAKEDKTGKWQTLHFTSFDNPTLNQQALKELRESGDMSQDSFRREIMAEDDEIEQSWLVYGRWNEAKCKIKRFEIPKTWPVYSAHDFGKSNPAALFCAMAVKPFPAMAPATMRSGDLILFREYAPGGGRSAGEHILEFQRLTKEMNVVGRVGGNITTEDEIRQAYGVQGWPIAEPSITKVNAQIERVNALIEGDRLYIFEDCYGLLGQMMSAMWELDNENKPLNKIKDETRHHFLAALRYLATKFNSIPVIDTGRSNIIPVYQPVGERYGQRSELRDKIPVRGRW